MKNILSYYQPVLDYTLPNLEYSTILKLQKVINLEEPYYTQQIDTIGKTELITFLKEKCNRKNAIGDLTNLTNLSIYNNNEIIRLPESIGNLINLTKLWIEFTKLSSLPDSIGNLTKLILLNISDNNLTSLPDSIGNFINLQYLLIKNNQLTNLPDSIGNLINLKSLSIYNNNLISLPKSVNLLKLYIDDRYLEGQNLIRS